MAERASTSLANSSKLNQIKDTLLCRHNTCIAVAVRHICGVLLLSVEELGVCVRVCVLGERPQWLAEIALSLPTFSLPTPTTKHRCGDFRTH